jgi:hypothetical protein
MYRYIKEGRLEAKRLGVRLYVMRSTLLDLIRELPLATVTVPEVATSTVPAKALTPPAGRLVQRPMTVPPQAKPVALLPRRKG